MSRAVRHAMEEAEVERLNLLWDSWLADVPEQCLAVTNRGGRCKRRPMPDSLFCAQHGGGHRG